MSIVAGTVLRRSRHRSAAAGDRRQQDLFASPDHIGRWCSGRWISPCARARSSRSSVSPAPESPLLRILAGLLPRAEGPSSYRGKPVTGPVRGIAMVFQALRCFRGSPSSAMSNWARGRAFRPPSGGDARSMHRRDRPRRVRDRLFEGIVRRHAPARRLCPRPGRQPTPAARRALLAARRLVGGDLAQHLLDLWIERRIRPRAS